MQKWNSRIPFPKDNFVFRCTDEQFTESKSSGNPMIVLTFELDHPESYNINGEDYEVVGSKVTQYFTTQVFVGEGAERTLDVEKTKNCATRLEALYKAFGLDFTNFNPENPALGFKGKLVWCLTYPDEVEQRKSPTKEQLAKGIKQGDVLKNPVTGKPLIQWFPKISDIFGLADAQPNKPF